MNETKERPPFEVRAAAWIAVKPMDEAEQYAMDAIAGAQGEPDEPQDVDAAGTFKG